MLKNYLKIALRSLQRHKAYSFINIAGLAIGMASGILILLWVQHELSYDRWHEHAGQIYRLTSSAGDFDAAVSPPGATGGFQSEIPVIKNTVRLDGPRTALFEAGEHKFEETRIFYADSTFLDIFSFPLVKGDVRTALRRPDGILITEEMAKKYFGKEDPIGKVLRKSNNSNVVVTGVLANIPANSHLQFDFILPTSAEAGWLSHNLWDNFSFYDYVQLDDHFDATPAALAVLNHQLDEIYKKHETNLKLKWRLQPLTDIHLRSHLQADLAGNGNILYVNIFFVVAIFIMIVACINFMNLATARSARRAREVGLRKVVGAVRRQLIGQFLGESILISFFALVVALLLVWMTLPLFNTLAGKQLSIHLWDGRLLLSLLGIAVVTGLISGSYPALFLSGFQPVKVLKGNLRTPGGNRLFRDGLVVMQFMVSIVLLVGTVVIFNQLQYIKSRNLGYEKEHLLYMEMRGAMWDKRQTLRDELARNPLTSHFTVISEIPANLTSGTVNIDWPGKDPKFQIVFPSMDVSEDFFDVFHMRLLSGRAFSPLFKADSNNYILNEKAVRIMGMTPAGAVGQQISFQQRKGTVIGVVQDFNFKPIQQAIEPLVIQLNKWGGTVVVRAKPGATEATISALGKISRELNPAYPFSFSFLDQELANQYKGEQQMGSIFNLFAVLAIFISCLGLYGLSAYMAEQRTKEIGVRKVLGASLFNILRLLSTDFTRLILIAAVIAIPLSWWAVDSWLQSFAYHIRVSWVIFALAPLAALLIAWVTVSYESIKAGVVNPAKSLRAE
ncbi:MAG: ABC transporter permease [Chitinophagaceae bacterium]|nr:ABC transporter permease [Chitinophagaceae bacterium]